MKIIVGLVAILIVISLAIWQGPKLINSGQNALQKTQQDTVNIWEKQIEKQSLAGQIFSKLTTETKQQIDQWLLAKNLNQYGDAEEVVYTGGTPLFDEKTGISKDRYLYILEHHPEMIEQLQLDKLVK